MRYYLWSPRFDRWVSCTSIRDLQAACASELETGARRALVSAPSGLWFALPSKEHNAGLVFQRATPDDLSRSGWRRIISEMSLGGTVHV